MPLYNTGKYVRQAVISLLQQSFTDFELIIINDASVDEGPDIVKEFSDYRIRLLTNENNIGIPSSRNRGLREAKGKFIASFDSDDEALPGKLEKQIRFLESNPTFGIVGSWVKKIDQEGKRLPYKWKLPAKPEAIPSILLFRNYFCHSAVIMRREAIPDGGYDTRFKTGEDYKMWIEITRKWQAWNLPEYLVHYRVHPQSITTSNPSSIKHHDRQAYKESFSALGLALSDEQLDLLLMIKDEQQDIDPETQSKIEQFLQLVIKQNAHSQVFSQVELKRTILGRWFKVCMKSGRVSPAKMLKFMQTPLFRTCLF